MTPLSERISHAVRALLGKAITSPRDWAGATVTTGESVSRGHHRNDLAAMMARGNGYPGIWASLNATVCASQNLRLYRAKGEPDVMSRSRKCSRKRLEHMRSGGGGAKIADWAERTGEVEEVVDHPVLDLLTFPNPFWSGSEMDRLGYWCREISGNWFEELVNENVKGLGLVPVARYPMWPQYVEIVCDDSGFITGYRYGRNSIREQVLSLDDVIHFRHEAGTHDPYLGRGPLHSVLAAVDLIAANMEHDIQFVTNGMRPDAVAYVPPETTDTQINAARSEIERTQRGMRNVGRWLFLRVIKLEIPSWSPKELQSLDKLKELQREVRNAMGVPESLADLNNANLASSTVGFDRQYLAATIRPRINAHAEALTLRLLPKFGIEPGEMWFCYDNPVPDDRDFLLRDSQIRTQYGLRTINEARSENGEVPIDGGDVLRYNGVPLDQVGQSVGLFGGLQVPPQFQADKARAHESELARHPAYHRIGCKCPWCHGTAHKDAGDRISELEARLSREFQRTLSRWFAALAGKPPTDPDRVNLSDQAESLRADLMGEFEKLVREGAMEAIRLQGGDPSAFSVVPESALRFLESYVIRLANAITAETEQRIRSVLLDGLRQGMTVAERSQAVAAALGREADYRSERIARTETATAMGAGRIEGYKALGYTGKRWLLAANACEFCRAAASEFGSRTIPIDEPFYRVGETIVGVDGGTLTLTWRDVQYPPLHPNDRCGVLPVREDA